MQPFGDMEVTTFELTNYADYELHSVHVEFIYHAKLMGIIGSW